MTKIKINLRRLKTITKCQFIISETKKNIISNIYALKKIFLNFKKKNTYPNSGTKIIIKKITKRIIYTINIQTFTTQMFILHF